MAFVLKLTFFLFFVVCHAQNPLPISNPSAWIKSRESSLAGYDYVTFDCKEFLITVICYENRCGPRKQSLENFFKYECKPYLENHLKEKKGRE